MAWLRKMPMYSVVLLGLAGLILAAPLGYSTYAKFSATRLTNSAGHGEVYQWHGERLLLQQPSGSRSSLSSTCDIVGRDGAKRVVYVPRNFSTGMFNTPDFLEVPPQPGTTATITCSRTVDITAGDSAVARTRTVNSAFFKAGVPALATIPVLALLGIPALRRTRSQKNTL